MTSRQTNTSNSNDNAALVKLYPPREHKNQWQKEAEEHETSASKYLQELIQEARFLRQQGQLKIGDRRQVEQLRDEVDQLEQQLENTETQQRTSDIELVTEEEARRLLETNYTSIAQILERLLQDEGFRRKIRLQLET
ncbi:hypothetical protein, partial [Natronococcus sp.]|uniref:hypothetical protein n=1 Tax=Natronococcus sp. TaxID=35747 RepID=UPI003A4E13DF